MQCGAARIGFEICTELWSFEHALLYGKEGVHIIVTPRATSQSTSDKWLVGGRATAVVSGAYSLSSNHVSFGSDPVHFVGQGWIIVSEGEVLGLNSEEGPFVRIEIALEVAEVAKHTYPRYVL